MKRPPFTTVGAVGVAAGCAGMVAMLPGAAAGVLGAIGLSGSSALARTFSPVAEPLFIFSAVLVILGALACSRLVAVLAVAGTVLLYLSMFQLASGSSWTRTVPPSVFLVHPRARDEGRRLLLPAAGTALPASVVTDRAVVTSGHFV